MAAAGVQISNVSFISLSFSFSACRTQVPGGPEGAVRRNPASDFGPDTGVGYRDNPLRLPYPPQADSQPGADSSGQISVQTHGIGTGSSSSRIYQVEKAKALLSKGEER